MKIVKLNDDYIRFIQESNRFPRFHNYGIGLILYFKGDYVFIPITKKKIDFLDKDNRFFPIGEKKKYGTLLISSYVYIKNELIEPAREDNRIKNENIFFKKHQEVIIKKLRNQINFTKTRSDKAKKIWLEEYLHPTFETRKQRALSMTKKVVESLALIEKVSFTVEDIEKVINMDELHNIVVNVDEIQTILKLKETWDYMINDLETPVDLNYIININTNIAAHQALEVGKIRDKIVWVSRTYEVLPQKKEHLENFLYTICKNPKLSEFEILRLLCHMITKQWFFDGNKRTAILIANKLLLSNGLGFLIISKENTETFNTLLENYYNNKGFNARNKLIEFMITKCIVR